MEGSRATHLIQVITVLAIRTTQQMSPIRPDLQERLWIQSHSGFKEWALTVGRCHQHLKPRHGHQNREAEKEEEEEEVLRHEGDKCQNEPQLIQRQGTLPEGKSSSSWSYNHGIIMSVFHPRLGNRIFNKVFPLWLYWAHWADLQWHLQRVTPGHLVILSLAITGASGIRNATETLQEMGSLLAEHLTPGAHWSWVFIKGGRTISEVGVLHSQGDAHLHTQLSLQESPYPTASNTLEKSRWSYCETVGGMGELCDEYNPSFLPIPEAPHLDKTAMDMLSKVPVIITAGNRQQYLYYTLTSLLAAHGSKKSNVLVVVGGKPHLTLRLLDLLSLEYVSLPLKGNRNLHLFNYYRQVFLLVSQKFAHAPAAIFLDEDVEVSKDFFSYMSQTLALLYNDPTLYCSNGFSASSGTRKFTDETTIRRGSVQVEWGYAVTMEFIKEILSTWKMKETNTLLYDYHIYLNIRGDRECLFPEQSRTRHYGMGINTAAELMEHHNFDSNLVQRAPIRLQNVNKLEINQWRSDLSMKIHRATPLVKNPCDGDFLPEAPLNSSYVFYYRLDHSAVDGQTPDQYQYFHTNNCLGLWAASEQGHHEGVTILRFAKEASLYLVGVPYSSYSHLKPFHIPLWDVDTITDTEFFKMQNTTIHKMDIKNSNTTTEDVLHKFVIVKW
ncbi:protein O-linked-mannose beta-1,2-N-acetylglucosaminyltransferase 1-like [Macrobrachium nipponense]|uniref:protein O-linked-mannose beta-1,2-N-acetylglucosaminyltransferase 1-like n=1 Tax=Macrobrachium nipponense TaxID=159736 RepID=UPI0030C7C789